MRRRLLWILVLVLTVEGLSAAPLHPDEPTPTVPPLLDTPKVEQELPEEKQPAPQSEAADPSGWFDPDPADIAAAVEVMTRDDHGVVMPTIRWDAPRVPVEVVGPAADPSAVADVDEVLVWLSAATGIDFHRTNEEGAPMVVHLDPDVDPHAHTTTTAGDWTIHRIEVFYDPANPRWPWEEIVGSVGAFGDWANHRLSIFSTDQTLTAPSPFDAWLIRQLYTVPPGTHPAELGGLLTEG